VGSPFATALVGLVAVHHEVLLADCPVRNSGVEGAVVKPGRVAVGVPFFRYIGPGRWRGAKQRGPTRIRHEQKGRPVSVDQIAVAGRHAQKSMRAQRSARRIRRRRGEPHLPGLPRVPEIDRGVGSGRRRLPFGGGEDQLDRCSGGGAHRLAATAKSGEHQGKAEKTQDDMHR